LRGKEGWDVKWGKEKNFGEKGTLNSFATDRGSTETDRFGATGGRKKKERGIKTERIKEGKKGSEQKERQEPRILNRRIRKGGREEE